MDKKLKGKVAIVTGSGQGIGRGIAMGLARLGAKVITNNRKPYTNGSSVINPNLTEAENKKLLSLRGDAEGTANEIKEKGGIASPFYGDVSDFETARNLIQFAIDTYGRIDIIVNNAAGLGTEALVNTSSEDWDYMTVPKMKGAFNCMKHAAPHMMKQKFGRVINVASDAWVGMTGASAYSAGNAGIVGLTKATAKELHRAGITVNAICPQGASPGHLVEFTAMIKKLEKQGVQIDKERMKMVEDDHGPSENLAPFVAYLCTEESDYINGAVFSVTASGRITLYSEPVRSQTIKKDNCPWTMEELMESVPNELLQDYKSIVLRNDFQ